MVKVQEVHDSPYTSSDSAHSGSSDSLASSISDDDEIQKESLVDRLVALVDIVPPQTRHSITTRVSNFVGAVRTSGKIVGNVVWVITTSALLIGLPLAFALEDEAKIVQQEKEMAAQQQGVQQVRLYTFFRPFSADVASAAQMVNPGTNLYPQLDASGQRKEGIVPPGF
jgi:import receptor subunit TOM22